MDKHEVNATCVACRKVLENARADGSGSSLPLRSSYNPPSAQFLYKKRTTLAKPYGTCPVATFAHLIHSHTHNLWGQLSYA